jgi:hypothetical protein
MSSKKRIKKLFKELFKVSFYPDGKRPKDMQCGTFYEFRFGDIVIRYGYSMEEKKLNFEVDYDGTVCTDVYCASGWPFKWGTPKQGIKFIVNHLNLKKLEKILLEEIDTRKFESEEKILNEL